MKTFEGWDDPCPLTERTDLGLVAFDNDGLNREWGKRTFVNPPYSESMPWVEKAIMESKKGKTVVLLVKVDSSTRWWFKLVESGARFALFTGRLSFSGEKLAAFPSALCFLVTPECAEG